MSIDVDNTATAANMIDRLAKLALPECTPDELQFFASWLHGSPQRVGCSRRIPREPWLFDNYHPDGEFYS
jgi:hypothetical protein